MGRCGLSSGELSAESGGGVVGIGATTAASISLSYAICPRIFLLIAFEFGDPSHCQWLAG
jgi:hypothetical protein